MCFNGAERLNPRKSTRAGIRPRQRARLQWGREIEPSEMHTRGSGFVKDQELQWGREIEPSEIGFTRFENGA